MLERVKRLAEKLEHRNYRHVAIVLRGGSLISIASNVSRHAEVAALSKLFPSKRVGTTVISLRIRKDGSLAMARPCKHCMAFIRESGVKKVYWSNQYGVMVKEKIHGP